MKKTMFTLLFSSVINIIFIICVTIMIHIMNINMSVLVTDILTITSIPCIMASWCMGAAFSDVFIN